MLIFPSFNSLFAQDNNLGFKKVSRIAKRLVRKKKVPGIAISVIKDGLMIYSEGFGYSDIEGKKEVKPDSTIFRIGSISKPIAAVGLAKMVDAKTISLDSFISTYIPYFPQKKYDFTIKQLGGHLAGIRNYKGNEFMNNKPLSVEEGVDIFINDSLLFEPGKDYLYTSYSWNLIALAMQEAAKDDFETLINDKVLSPIGMNNTYPDKNQSISHKAKFYKKKRFRVFKETKTVNNYYKLASGGYLSTSEDIAIFGSALLKGNIISPNVFDEFITSQYINDKKTYYGIGFQTSFDSDGRAYYGHIGNGLGGYGIFYVYPKEKVVCVILTNCSDPNQDRKLNKIISHIFSELDLD
ncbi:50S ribosomal protein L19 [Flavobacteriales bacterium ALC-1]|nr:50S ribosomal protein L19 [Flavobacteriales bacterium ALC-1]